MEKTPAITRLLLSLSLVAYASVAEPVQEGRESVKDRIVHVEDEITVDIPYLENETILHSLMPMLAVVDSHLGHVIRDKHPSLPVSGGLQDDGISGRR